MFTHRFFFLPFNYVSACQNSWTWSKFTRRFKQTSTHAHFANTWYSFVVHYYNLNFHREFLFVSFSPSLIVRTWRLQTSEIIRHYTYNSSSFSSFYRTINRLRISISSAILLVPRTWTYCLLDFFFCFFFHFLAHLYLIHFFRLICIFFCVFCSHLCRMYVDTHLC
jgi:hypothetical protein